MNIARGKTPNGIPFFRTSDFLIAGNDNNNVHVTLSNVVVNGDTTTCSDPPLSKSGTCGNACYSADVKVLDGSVDIACMLYNATTAVGSCAPLLGTTAQRCTSGHANKSKSCNSGWVCA